VIRRFIFLFFVVAVLAFVVIAAFSEVENYLPVRTVARWLVRSHHYKAEVMVQPNSVNGELKHIEWDGWGFPGAGDTTVYLVFDPTDSLVAAAKTRQTGKFSGIPCEVFSVRRLERGWYTVQFYTDEWWGRRNRLNCE
jgi:hypothetical protein